VSQHLDAGAVGALAHVWEERGCLYCVAYFSDGQVDRCVDAAEVRALAEDWLSLKAERDDLTARVEALKQHNDDLDQQITKNDLQDATTWRKLREAEAERDRLREALGKVKESLCRDVPDSYSQPCVDEDAAICDAIIDAALAPSAAQEDAR